ncbi:extracellular solute-binding protein [Corallincola platygyrae]|uniref:Extracellular solute-binding protein n=1 Tax=Corallincola platygyrae TaxID=1193278 RepID=A0ABW4XLK2_9GAMM
MKFNQFLCALSCLLLFITAAKAATLELWFEKYEAKPVFDDLAIKFQQETGINLKSQHMPTGDLKAAIIQGVSEDKGPDIVFAPSDFIGNHALLKLSEVDQVELTKGIKPEAMASVTEKGSVYGVPLLFGNHLLLYYNKRFVESPATTWQELLSQRKDIEGKGTNLISWKPMEMYWLIPFLTAFDGRPVDGDKVTLNTPEFKKGLAFYREQVDAGLINMRCSYECVYDHFLQGQYAYTINGDWAYRAMKASLGDDFGVAVLPSVEGRDMTPMTSSIALMFPGNSLGGEANKQINMFVQFMLRPENLIHLHEMSGMMPSQSETYDELEQKYSADPNMQAFFQQMKHTIPMPPTPQMSAAWIGMAKGVSVYMRKKASLDDSGKLMQVHAERELARQLRAE